MNVQSGAAHRKATTISALAATGLVSERLPASRPFDISIWDFPPLPNQQLRLSATEIFFFKMMTVKVTPKFTSIGGRPEPGTSDWDRSGSGLLAFAAENSIALWDPLVSCLLKILALTDQLTEIG